MAQVQVYNQEGRKTSKLELADSVFGIEPNADAMHLAVVSYLANQRQGTQSTLTRSEVSGGGAKPWRQKGTGRARQGSTRSPQWTHGGIALGPKPRKYKVELNKKVKRLAMKSALSTKVADEEMMVVNKVEFEGIKTKAIVEMLAKLKAAKKTLIVTDGVDEVIYKSARNIEGVKVVTVNTLCVYDILNCDSFVVLKDAAKKIEEVYA
ncbi:50S ribosomal protein L4 [uncultured Eubacterium sp.]|uniref:50S ribosomal protein L4 n=1 Tax=uncultured Eubacterium sp. TaxID=165185 RepID=UPI0025FCB09D|nr:50S ribosomal protein L4 [uncultured Eubacterium sp.]